MTEGGFRKDLIVLVADKDMEFAVHGLLGRSKSLGIRIPSYDIKIHSQHDNGCFKRGHNLLILYHRSHKHALIMFDREGCGREGLSRNLIEQTVEENLNQSGWDGRCAAIAIDPELENWVWSSSPHVETFLGWNKEFPELRNWLTLKGYLNETAAYKPTRPKEAVEKSWRKTGKKRSPSLYRQLAENVSLTGCTDEAFIKFRKVLSNWFPASTTK